MKKVQLILSMIFLFNGLLLSQVFISNVYAKGVLLGPKNVDFGELVIADAYLRKINLFHTKVNALKISNLEKINQIEAKKKIRKKDSKKLKRLNSDQKRIDIELASIEELKKNWEDLKNQNKSFLALSKLLESEDCVAIKTNEGMFSATEVEVEFIHYPKEFDYKEMIPVKSIFTSEGWVKKGKPGCVSMDPKDCQMYCLVVNTTCQLDDLNGVELDVNESELGMNVDLKTKSVISKKHFKAKNNEAEVQDFIFKSKKTGKAISIESWNKIEC